MAVAKEHRERFVSGVFSRQVDPKAIKAKCLFVLLSITLVACMPSDFTSTSYESYAKAQIVEALGAAAWLPGTLPRSAVDIRETHNVFTNEIWFSYLSTSNDPPDKCNSRMVSELKFPRARNVREITLFHRDLNLLKKSGRAIYYRCRDEEYDYYLAVDSESGRAFGWSPGSAGVSKLP